MMAMTGSLPGGGKSFFNQPINHIRKIGKATYQRRMREWRRASTIKFTWDLEQLDKATEKNLRKNAQRLYWRDQMAKHAYIA